MLHMHIITIDNIVEKGSHIKIFDFSLPFTKSNDLEVQFINPNYQT
jgi:hypothetical protein